MENNGTSRVRYFERQFLRTEDFVDEQAWHLAMRRRHNVSHHSWGIVSGLELVVKEGSILVRPGLAIDGYGRELLLAEQETIGSAVFDDFDAEILDVYLGYDRIDTSPAGTGYAGCGESPLDSPYRSSESPKLIFERAVSVTVNARRPKAVPTVIFDSPLPPSSDSPKDAWPVYLGRIKRDLSQPEEQRFTAYPGSDRPYAGLTGGVVVHPAGLARIELAHQRTADEQVNVRGSNYTLEAAPGRKFGIFVPEAAPANPTTWLPRMEIDRDGRHTLRGDTTVNGSLTVTGGALQFIAPNVDLELTAEDPCIYRVTGKENDKNVNELRIDLGRKAGNPADFVIGYTAEDGKFKECIRIVLQPNTNANDPRPFIPLVKIDGDLEVTGQIECSNFNAIPLSDEAAAILMAMFQAGAANGGSSP